MKKILLVVLVLIGWFCLASSSRVLAQQSSVQAPVTLYSPIKYGDENHKFCLNLRPGVLEANKFEREPCHLKYGFVYAGDNLDWLGTSMGEDRRSVMKDLGKLEWTSRFKVPVMAALPKLAPGEHRTISMDFGPVDPPAQIGSVYASMSPGDDFSVPNPYTPKRKRLESPQTDPKFILAKASLGHLYVVHVVDDVNDFYALVRVDAVERGDHCTISWRLIPAPEPKATRGK